MNEPRYCVYNQTNECFLSLGVSGDAAPKAQAKELVVRGSIRSSDGRWLARPSRVRTAGLFSSRDLIYLDRSQKVTYVLASVPALRMAPVRADAASVLVMPVSTIEVSQTQVGNQLVICVAEEMESRLRAESPESADEEDCEEALERPAASKPVDLPVERRLASSTRIPYFTALDSNANHVAQHGTRDISAAGIYVATSERWPVGATVRMSLQRTDGFDESSTIPITMDLRVSHCGENGVGLEFVPIDVEHSSDYMAARPVALSGVS